MHRSGRWPHTGMQDEAINLETDVMRFMAILGFCLMIVFALVQAIPVSSTTSTAQIAVQLEAAEQTVEEVPRQVQEQEKEQRQEQVPVKVEAQWSLRFASDSALLQLMRQNNIRLYMQGDDGLRQLLPNGQVLPVSGEFQLYQMEANTVPGLFRQLAGHDASGSDVGWSVSLSVPVAQAIQSAMESHSPTRLLIEANGSVRPRNDHD